MRDSAAASRCWLTVIIPSYRGEQWIRTALRSLVAERGARNRSHSRGRGRDFRGPRALRATFLIVCDCAPYTGCRDPNLLARENKLLALPQPSRITSVGLAWTMCGSPVELRLRMLGSRLIRRHLYTSLPVQSSVPTGASWGSGAASHSPKRSPASVELRH